MSTILVTGGAGFIGSHLCEKYTKEGHTVICYDNFLNGGLSNIRGLLANKNFKLVRGDVRDYAALEKVICDADHVMHLAAQIHVDRAIVEPQMTVETNVIGTLNVLELARIHDVQKIIHASTSEVYGPAKYAPMDEDHPLDAPHTYGASKIAADRLCKAYYSTYGLDVSIMRQFNVFGPKQKDTGYGGVIAIFLKRVLAGSPPVIYGNGKQTRDYTYITDVVNAYDALFRNKKELHGEPINFGTGKEVSIESLANMIIKLAGKKELKPVYVDPRPGEVNRLICNNARAKKLLGWEPKVEFEDGLKKLVDWYVNFKSEEWSKLG